MFRTVATEICAWAASCFHGRDRRRILVNSRLAKFHWRAPPADLRGGRRTASMPTREPRAVDRVWPKLGARVWLLAAGNVNKNDPNDARSVTVAALRSPAVREARPDDHAAVLKVWSERRRDLASSRTQVVCRLHAVLCELVPGGVNRRRSSRLTRPGCWSRSRRRTRSRPPAASSPRPHRGPAPHRRPAARDQNQARHRRPGQRDQPDCDLIKSIRSSNEPTNAKAGHALTIAPIEL
jgi:hypothetical protein